MPREEFEEVLQANIDMEHSFRKQLEERLELSLKRIDILQQKFVADKVIHQISALASRFGRYTDEGWKLPFSLPQQTVAELVGSTRESVSVELHALKINGLVEYDSRGRFIVPDITRLKEAASSTY